MKGFLKDGWNDNLETQCDIDPDRLKLAKSMMTSFNIRFYKQFLDEINNPFLLKSK